MASRAFNWTNSSVLQFAADENPVKKMEQVARAFVLKAMEQGWKGPPFDPVELASINQIRVRPNASIVDARVLVEKEREFVIEYNPHKSRGRVNYFLGA